MKKADVIKKGLECCATAVCDSCPYKNCESYDECTSALAADTLTLIQHYERVIANQEKNNGLLEDAVDKISELIPKWISVEERLPKGEPPHCPTVNVLTIDGKVLPGFCNHGKWYVLREEVDFCNDAYEGEVTHWMPLPEPTQEGRG